MPKWYQRYPNKPRHHRHLCYSQLWTKHPSNQSSKLAGSGVSNSGPMWLPVKFYGRWFSANCLFHRRAETCGAGFCCRPAIARRCVYRKRPFPRRVCSHSRLAGECFAISSRDPRTSMNTRVRRFLIAAAGGSRKQRGEDALPLC